MENLYNYTCAETERLFGELFSRQGKGAYVEVGSKVPLGRRGEDINYIRAGFRGASVDICIGKLASAGSSDFSEQPKYIVDIVPKTRRALAQVMGFLKSGLPKDLESIRIVSDTSGRWKLSGVMSDKYDCEDTAPVLDIGEVGIFLAEVGRKVDLAFRTDGQCLDSDVADGPGDLLKSRFEVVEPEAVGWKIFGLGYDAGVGNYIGGFFNNPAMSKYESGEKLLDRLEELFMKKRFSDLADYRTHSHTPREVRHFIAKLLDMIVDMVDDDFNVLQTIAMYGFDKSARITAVGKLTDMVRSGGDKADLGRSALERLSGGRRMKSEYLNSEVQALAAKGLEMPV
jgi:hypothetical protein